MNVLIDTNIAIHLRDGEEHVLRRYAALQDIPLVSVVTLVELSGGLVTGLEGERVRRASLVAALTEDWSILQFSREMAACYEMIVASTGFSRTRILDRMIAATALVANVSLATINVRDFRDVPGLQIEDWSN